MDSTAEAFNPWFTIWTQPRETIRRILETDPRHLVLLLAILAGFSHALNRASLRDMGDFLPVTTIFFISAAGGALGGLLTLFFFAGLLGWTGRWIGGEAPHHHLRAVIAWSSVPLIWALLLWLPELVLFGAEMFTSSTPRIDANPMLALLLLGFALVEITIAIWAFVVFLNCLGEAQGFSAWKALGNVSLAGLVMVVPIVVVMLVVVAAVA